MANGHGHGAFGAQILGTQDMTKDTSAMSDTLATEVSQDTGFQPADDTHTFLQGLTGIAASCSMWFVNDKEFILRELSRLQGTSSDPIMLTRAWRGFKAGKYVTMYRVLNTEFSRNVSNSSTISKSINHQCSGVVYDGWALFNPFGSDAYESNEVQVITLTSVPDTTRLGVKALGGSTIADVSDPTSSASWKSAIESLPEYTSVTVTGSVTLSGSNWSGSKTCTFGGSDADTNLPALVVVSGEVQTLTVSSPSGNYKWNSSADFAAGDSVSAIQTKIQATSGLSTALVDGTSTAPNGLGTNYALAATLTDIQNFNYDHGGSNVLNDGSNSSGYIIASTTDASYFIFDLGASHSIALLRMYCGGGSVVSGVTTTVDLSTTGVFGGEETSVELDLNINDNWNEASASVTARYVRFTVPATTNLNVVEFEVRGPATGGSLALNIRSLASDGNIGQKSATGTGAVAATSVQGGSAASGVTVVTSVDGSSPSQRGGAIWNLVTGTEAGEWHDANTFLPTDATETESGLYIRMQVPLAAGTGFTVVIEHADSTGGSATTLHTFTVTDITVASQLAQEYVAAAGTAVKRFVRARFTSVTGSFAVALSYARESY